MLCHAARRSPTILVLVLLATITHVASLTVRIDNIGKNTNLERGNAVSFQDILPGRHGPGNGMGSAVCPRDSVGCPREKAHCCDDREDTSSLLGEGQPKFSGRPTSGEAGVSLGKRLSARSPLARRRPSESATAGIVVGCAFAGIVLFGAIMYAASKRRDDKHDLPAGALPTYHSLSVQQKEASLHAQTQERLQQRYWSSPVWGWKDTVHEKDSVMKRAELECHQRPQELPAAVVRERGRY
ncbi:hypothetical protein F4780DRAFT_180237 [Xylariomycetidae sp. FL0641]|nr:hypothetical protein F4780DRAFT_180237 [Xylariomycetidae sp. FL0641]